MQRVRLLGLVALLIGLNACEYIEQLTGTAGGLPEGVEEQIKRGDWPGAMPKLAEASKADPTNVEVATYLAFTQMMSGDYAGADKTLAAAQDAAPDDKKPEIQLRRALIGLRTRDMDAVREHAKASGLNEGKLLAAEVHIVDLEADSARPLLQEIQNDPTVVGETAKKYLEMLDQGAVQEGLAEVTALWALGDRATACDHASEIIPDLDDGPEKSELQLLWASRALTSGKVGVANALVSEILELPSPDQAWRLQATKAQIAIAEGEYEKGMEMLNKLEGGAPADGLADARATACALAADKEVAIRIAGDLKSNAIAWCLERAGAHDEAKQHSVPGSKMKDFLEKK
ncbi:MAG: tetratricopeptide repeat protein [Myxococcota bacterium]